MEYLSYFPYHFMVGAFLVFYLLIEGFSIYEILYLGAVLKMVETITVRLKRIAMPNFAPVLILIFSLT